MACNRVAPASALELVIPEAVPKDSSGTFQGYGTSLAWFAHATGGEEALRERLCTLLFSREGLGFNIVRYNIGGANLQGDDIHRFRAGGAVPCCCSPDGSYTSGPDAAQVAYLLRARELIGPESFLSEAFANSPPYFMLKSGTSRGGTRPYKNNLRREEVGAYAASLLAALAHFREAHGLAFNSLSPFNEPGSPAWITAISGQEGCYFSRSRMSDVLRALWARRTALGSTALVAHDQYCVSDAHRDVRGCPRDVWQAVERVNTHTYNSKIFLDKAPRVLTALQDNGWRRAGLRRAVAARGKELWVSEFGTGQGAEALARHILRDLSTLLPTAWVYWQAVEEPGSTWGLLQVPFAPQTSLPTVKFTPQYHVMKLFVRKLPRGCRLFTVQALSHRGVGAWLGPGQCTFAVVNPSKSHAPLTVKVNAGALCNAGPASSDASIQARITLLDVAALDAAGVAGGGDVGEGGREVVREVGVGVGVGAGVGGEDVLVPPGYLCFIEVGFGVAPSQPSTTAVHNLVCERLVWSWLDLGIELD